jgi:F0F1-type ATP synthase assembly protein I
MIKFSEIRLMAEKPPSSWAYLLGLSQVGLEMVVPIGLGVLLDLYFQTTPWLMVIGVAAGLLVGWVQITTLLRRLDRAEKSSKNSQKKQA